MLAGYHDPVVYQLEMSLRLLHFNVIDVCVGVSMYVLAALLGTVVCAFYG